jgi:prepilin-type N-terminal cleavage/methylation domain-containing protein
VEAFGLTPKEERGRGGVAAFVLDLPGRRQSSRGFSLLELLVVVIVVAILAAVGAAKYQDVVTTSQRKTCLQNLQTIEKAMAAWEVENQAFPENAKCGWGLTPRSGKLTGVSCTPSILPDGVTPEAISDIATQPTLGAPSGFCNKIGNGPLSGLIRDDKVWICPSALVRSYGSNVQDVPDDYLDLNGGGVVTPHVDTPLGLSGRYLCAVAGPGTRGQKAYLTNGGFHCAWLTGWTTEGSVNSAHPCPQAPFKLAICGCYGTFGPSVYTTVPGWVAVNGGGPVGPDGSIASRHSARW